MGVLYLVGAVFLVGGLAIALAHLLSSRREVLRELRRLYLFELALVGFVVVPAHLGTLPFMLAILALCLLAQAELRDEILPTPSLPEKAFLALSSMAALVASQLGSETDVGRVLFVSAHLLLVAELGAPFAPARLERLGKMLLILVYPVTFLVFLCLVRSLPDGFLLVFLLFGVGETNDSFAQLSGKLLGNSLGQGRPFPELSPRKTWPGLVGGLVSGGLFGMVAGVVLSGFSFRFTLGATLLVLLATILGDLVASKMKRDLGIKNFGNSPTMLGGFLDLYDSFFFGAPLFYWYVLYFR